MRPLAHPDPGVDDHAEDPLRADQHPVRAGAGARARQPPALPLAVQGHRPHRLDQVVDVGVEGREVAAGAGRDPAAQRRVLERLREVAQGEAVLAQLLLEHAARWRRPGSAPPSRPRRPRGRGPSAAGRCVTTPGYSLAHPRLDPADDAGAAAVGDRRRPLVGAEVEDDVDVLGGLGVRDQVGRVRELAPKAADDVAVGLAEGVRRPGRSGRRRTSPRSAFGGFRRGSGSSTASSGTGSSISSTSKPSRSVTALAIPST